MFLIWEYKGGLDSSEVSAATTPQHKNQNQNFTGDTSNDIHSLGPLIWEVSP